ncbi:MAG TPA: S1 RNA-binding domain-containing protein [Ktedonobacterales bacterium]|nr:S1 RNA-binding domain-containing protein [Ktedonobacterales bacterium]
MADDTNIDAMASASAPAATSEMETETDHAVPAIDPEEHDMRDQRDSMRDDANADEADADDADGADMSEMARLLDEQDVQFKSIKRGDVVEGQIVHIDADEILVDIGLKSEGVLSIKELPATGYGSREELNVGDNVLVYVVQPETPEGHAIVSIKRARLERQWRIAQEQSDRGELLEAEVIDFNKGGLIVNLEGIRGFVPISQILNLKREDNADNAETQQKLQAMVGRKLQLKIIEINRNRNRLILSERLAVQEWRARRREELLNELEVGEVRTGTVSNLANFGAFVDLGGADGLVHISQLAWSRVNHPSEVLKVGQKVEVQVLSVDKEKKKIALSIKRAEVDPWTTVESRYTVGQTVTGTITKIAPFGAFARIEDGVEGLIHLSELPSGVSDPKQVLHEGEEVNVRILRIDPERRRLGLSMRQAGDEGAGEAPGTEATSGMAAVAGASGEATDASSASAEGTTSTEEGAGVAATAAPRQRPQPARSEEPPTTAMAAAFAAATRRDQAPEAPAAEAAETTETTETTETAETAETALPSETAEAQAEASTPAEVLADIAHEAHGATAETQTLEPETPTPETPADAVPPDASEVEVAEAGAAKAVEAEAAAEAEPVPAKADSAAAPAEGAADVGPKAAETATDDTAHTPEGASEE